MSVTVKTTQKAVIRFDKDSTVLDLIQALTENLGGEWDDAKLQPPESTGNPLNNWRWELQVVLTDTVEPARASNWESDDGQHVARQNPDGTRTCSCNMATKLPEDDMRKHLSRMAGEQGWR